jgi:hypothetical protein
MLKKALWVYLGLYILGFLVLFISSLIGGTNNNSFSPVDFIIAIFLFIPPAAVALGLRGKRVPILLTLFGLLIIMLPMVAIFNFNNPDWSTLGKALLFMPMIASLIYYGYKRLFKKEDQNQKGCKEEA